VKENKLRGVSGYSLFPGCWCPFRGSISYKKIIYPSTIFANTTLNGNYMTTITDEYMYQMLPKTKEYCIVLLKPGPAADQPEVKKIMWEHGRRNFALRADGLLSIVCPVTVEGDLNGLGIFNASIDETKKIMDGDPAVAAAVFVYEVHLCRSFPGDSLP
jgi:hypothetical protein